ncbi:MAG TPA: energy transducer TonB [Casimicrobiaceae bacterium]|nr:energy transducer TonB [Casimicrobiaceae bacterium]
MLPERPPPLPPRREPPKPKPLARPVQQPIDPPPIVPSEIPPPPVAEENAITVATSSEPPPRAQAASGPEPPPVTPPRFNADYLQNPAPPYPRIARQLGERGKVMLRVLVSSEGLPERVELKTSSGSSRLDESALETVKHWKFVPARQGEQNVSAWVIVPIVFALDS